MKRIPTRFFVGVSVFALSAIFLYGQDRLIEPTRGFQPGHSYGLADIESIDKGTGIISLHIPITQLPPGPAGFNAGVTLSYSSRYWIANNTSSTTDEYTLMKSDVGGGWSLAMAPQLEMRFVPVLTYPSADPCDSGINNDDIQLNIVNPDGSRNLLYRSFPTVTMLPQCAGIYWKHETATTTSTWFTADGSYLRLVINSPSVSGSWPGNSSWTLYRQDGSSVYFDAPSQLTYLRDRNGNQITVEKGVTGGVPYDKMSNTFGQSDLPDILYQFDREYSEGIERDGGVGQGPAFEALAPHQR